MAARGIVNVAVIAAVLSFVAHVALADSSPNSELNCQPLLLEPMQNVTCTLYVRDSMAEPTTLFSPTDFFIRTLPTVQGVGITVFPLARSAFDPTILVFSVMANSGTQIRIDVLFTNTSSIVRNSGIVVNVLTWPATRLSPITCNVASLQLRQTMTCQAAAAGNTGLAAVIHPAEVAFAEDHLAGSFYFIQGQQNLVFNFTAFPTIIMTFNAFTIRVTLSSSNAVFSVTVPMQYPTLVASTRSRVQCSGGSSSPICYLSAMDNLGPVTFNASNFVVMFEKLDPVNNGWFQSNSFNLTLTPGQTLDTQILTWALRINNEISSQRLRIFTNPMSTSASSSEISGSPFVFTAGVLPTPQYVSFRKCSSVYILSQNSTSCVVDLLAGVTGDPRYFVLSSVLGGQMTTPVYGLDPVLNTPVMSFTYTAPVATQRLDDYISVIIAGSGSVNSPFHVVIYPSAVAPPTSQSSGTLPAIVAVGLLFYGTAFGVGGYFFARRQSRMKRVLQARVELAEKEELEREEELYRQEQAMIHQRAQQQLHEMHEVVALEDLLPPAATARHSDTV